MIWRRGKKEFQDFLRRLEKLEAENARLREENTALRRENELLRRENEKLRKELEKTRRSVKRQAAPFSKGPPKEKPERPGRKAGHLYGRKAWRAVPDHVDKTEDVRLPCRCPDCGGQIEELEIQEQYQEDIPPIRPVVTRFLIHIGRCTCCGKRIQPRHPRQTSDALGAAKTHLGPNAIAIACELNKRFGLSMHKTAGVMTEMFGLRVTAGGLSQGMSRVARKLEPTYYALINAVRRSEVVYADETGWKVAGYLQWLWVFVTPQVTVYAIMDGRGYDEACSILGENYDGILGRDGWRVYSRFVQAVHQTCTQHLLTRCRRMLQSARGRAAAFPRKVRAVLLQGLGLRDRNEAGHLSPHGFTVLRGKLEAELDRILQCRLSDESNRRLGKHLLRERSNIFTYLYDPRVEACNWPAEQATRPAVVLRKVWGGNRTRQGAHAQQILSTIIVTARKQNKIPRDIIASILYPREVTLAFSLTPNAP